MRVLIVSLALASLWACSNEAELPEAEEAAAALTYAGADYEDDEAAKLAHGERISTLMGCQGCHDSDLSGRDMADGENFNAPNLSLLLAYYSDEELARAVRGGVAKDGRSLYPIMPSAMYSQLDEADYEALVAHLRQFPPTGEAKPAFEPDEEFKQALAAGMLGMADEEVASMAATGGPLDLGSSHALGRYVAATACTECHGANLEGYEGFSPNLDIVGSFERDELVSLLTEGVGKTREDLGLMSMMGRVRFSQLTEEERSALIDYLMARTDANMDAGPQ